ncbi:hypothetical protein ACFOEK_10510 [Litoribrevibacter euphylliae]|uniref:HEAT repeat domain-containing protein n=1 Tax=Litoribrevibacter euphylliae TaxID=1834034 RepID=A0ABV7HC23_9GAMM
MRTTFLFFVTIFTLFPMGSMAAIETFVRDYTYNASENDSKVSARKAALQQLQVTVIQEVGVQVRSSFEVEDHVSNDELSRDVQAHYGTYAKALTKSVILEEKWNGETFYIKAEIIVDTDQVGQQIQRMTQPPGVAVKDPCEAKAEQAYDLIKNMHRKEKVEALVELALDNPIDEECHSWQLSAMTQFRLADMDDPEYRKYIFEQAEKESTSFQGDLLVNVLRYALRIKALSDAEWDQVLDILPSTDKRTASTVTTLLINHTRDEEAEGLSRYSAEVNDRKQDKNALVDKLDRLFTMAKNYRLGTEDKLLASEFALRALSSLPAHQLEVAFYYYPKMQPVMDTQDHQKLSRVFTSTFNKRLDERSLALLVNYFKDVEVNQQVSRSMHGVIQRLDREAKKPENVFQQKALIELMSADKEKMSATLSQMRTNQKEKNLWFVRFDLPNSEACSVEECAAQLFDSNKRTQQDASEYLAAYGDRAKSVEDKVIKKLTRVRALTKFEEPRYITSNLIRVLGNIGASSDEAYRLMVWGLDGKTKHVQEAAIEVMTQVGAKALPMMKEEYSKISQTGQRRIVNVVGTFKTKQSDAQLFLASIKPANDYIRFAIEDAQISLVPQ